MLVPVIDILALSMTGEVRPLHHLESDLSNWKVSRDLERRSKLMREFILEIRWSLVLVLDVVGSL